MAEHLGLTNAVKLLQAIEDAIKSIGEDPNLELARKQAEQMVDEAETLTERQQTLLRGFISEYLKVPGQMPAVTGLPDSSPG
jgi:hypothetical protein